MAGRASGRLLDPGRRSDEPVPLHEIEIEVMPRFGYAAADLTTRFWPIARQGEAFEYRRSRAWAVGRAVQRISGRAAPMFSGRKVV